MNGKRQGKRQVKIKKKREQDVLNYNYNLIYNYEIWKQKPKDFKAHLKIQEDIKKYFLGGDEEE